MANHCANSRSCTFAAKYFGLPFPYGMLTRLHSILYKTKLPFILVFNKTDVQPHDFALEWMQDFEEFQAALASHNGTRDAEGEPTYMNSLMNSMSLVLDEFYKHLKVCDWPSVSFVCFKLPLRIDGGCIQYDWPGGCGVF